MTVSELRKALKGVDGNLTVYTRDHDHCEFETNGIVGSAYVFDQKNMPDYDKKRIDDIFKIKGKYFVIAVR